MSESSRQGKIARLPHEIREEVNRRLLNGQSGQVIMAWLNAHPAVQAVLKDQFDGKPVNDQNLTHWREGGYAAWLARREQIDQTRQFASFAMDLAKSGGGDISAGAAAIAAGKVMELLEECSKDAPPLEQLKALVEAVATLRSGDLAEKKCALDLAKLKRKDQEIAQAERKLKLLEEKAGEAKAKLTTITKKGGISPETQKLIDEAVGLL